MPASSERTTVEVESAIDAAVDAMKSEWQDFRHSSTHIRRIDRVARQFGDEAALHAHYEAQTGTSDGLPPTLPDFEATGLDVLAGDRNWRRGPRSARNEAWRRVRRYATLLRRRVDQRVAQVVAHAVGEHRSEWLRFDTTGQALKLPKVDLSGNMILGPQGLSDAPLGGIPSTHRPRRNTSPDDDEPPPAPPGDILGGGPGAILNAAEVISRSTGVPVVLAFDPDGGAWRVVQVIVEKGDHS